MKKFLFPIATFAVISAGIYMSLSYTHTNKRELSNLQLSNIEALSTDEIEPGEPCYNEWKYDYNKPKAVVCGTPCKYEPANINFLQSTSICS